MTEDEADVLVSKVAVHWGRSKAMPSEEERAWVELFIEYSKADVEGVLETLVITSDRDQRFRPNLADFKKLLAVGKMVKARRWRLPPDRCGSCHGSGWFEVPLRTRWGVYVYAWPCRCAQGKFAERGYGPKALAFRDECWEWRKRNAGKKNPLPLIKPNDEELVLEMENPELRKTREGVRQAHRNEMGEAEYAALRQREARQDGQAGVFEGTGEETEDEIPF